MLVYPASKAAYSLFFFCQKINKGFVVKHIKNFNNKKQPNLKNVRTPSGDTSPKRIYRRQIFILFFTARDTR